jgi:hypothetical protein
VLSRLRPYHSCPGDLWDAGRGSLIHGVLETQTIENVRAETRFYKVITEGPFAPYVLSGQIDFYDPEKKSLEDFKSMEGDGVFTVLRYGIKDDHVLQLSTYYWLMNGGHLKPEGWTDPITPEAVLTWPQEFWPVERAQLHYVTMRRVFSTGTVFTFDEKMPMGDTKGPNSGRKFPGEIRREKLPSQWKPKWRVTAKLPEVELLSFEEVEEYVKTRGPNLVRGFKEDWLPPADALHSTDPKETWQCDYCEVRSICESIESNAEAA